MIREAKAAAEETERLRLAMLESAERRREAIRGLREQGLSVRKIADSIGVSKAVVQAALEKS